MSSWLDSGWLDQRQIKQRTKTMKLLDVLKRYDRKLMEESSKLVKKYKSLLKEEDLCDGGVCEDTYEDDCSEADYSDEEKEAAAENAARAASNAASTAAAAAARAARAQAVTPGPDFDQEEFEKSFGKVLGEDDVDECGDGIYEDDDLFEDDGFLSEAKKSKKSSKKPAAKKSSKAKKPAKKEDSFEDKDEVDVDLSMDDFFTEDEECTADAKKAVKAASKAAKAAKKAAKAQAANIEPPEDVDESEDDFDPDFNPDGDEEVDDDETKLRPTTGMRDTTAFEIAADNMLQSKGSGATKFEPDPEDRDEREAKAVDRFGLPKDKERDDLVDHFARFSVRDEGPSYGGYDGDDDDMYEESEKYMPGVDPSTLLPSEKMRMRDNFRSNQEKGNQFTRDGLPLDDEYGNDSETSGEEVYDPYENSRADEYLNEDEVDPSTLLPSEKMRMRDNFRSNQERGNLFTREGLPLDDEYGNDSETSGIDAFDPHENPRADEYLGEDEPSAKPFFDEAMYEDDEEGTPEKKTKPTDTDGLKAKPVNTDGLVDAKVFFSDEMTEPAIDPDKVGKTPPPPPPKPKKDQDIEQDDEEGEDLEESDFDDLVDEAEEDYINESLKAYRRKNYRLFD